MRASDLSNWNIVKICSSGKVGIVRNDCLKTEDRKNKVCIQLADKTALVISADTQVELVKDLPDIVYKALAEIVDKDF